MTAVTIAVALRLYTGKIVINHLGLDDYLVFFALVRPENPPQTLLQYTN
jgi:hypothetical protein